MQKDAYYFPHFSNARHDRKLKRIQKELGIEGYGIYFMLLEVLREMSDFSYPMSDIDLLADEFGTSEQKVRIVVVNYGLFEIDKREQFFSPKLLAYLEPYFRMKEQRRLAGKASAKSRQQKQLADGTTVERLLNENEQSKVKESKVKESKETHPLGVPINRKRYDNLCATYGQKTVARYMQKIVDYCDSKGKRYKDYAATAANWIRRDEEQGKVKQIKTTQGEVPEWAKE